MDKDTRRKAIGGAVAAGGAGLALGIPAVARTELKVAGHRTAKLDRAIHAAKEAIPKKPDPNLRLAGGRYTPESPKAKYERQAETKRAVGRVQELQRKRKKTAKPKVYPHQAKLWGTGLAVGVPTSYAGAHYAVDKRADKGDVNAAYAGGAAGFLGYQGGSLALKPFEKPAERKIKSNPKLKETLAEHRAKHLPKNAPAGHPGWIPYNREYPKHLPGARMKRINAHAVSGKTGGLATLAVTGGGAYGAVKLHRKHEEGKVKKSMSISAFGVDHGMISKLDYGEGQKPSTGRRVLASTPYASVVHPFVAGKKGKKARAAGNQIGMGALGAGAGSVGGSIAGAVLSRGNRTGSMAGSSIGGLGGAIYGQQRGLARNTRKGYLKPES